MSDGMFKRDNKTLQCIQNKVLFIPQKWK